MSTPTARETGMILDGMAAFDDAAMADQSPRVPPKEFLLLKLGKTAYTKGDTRGEYEVTPEDCDKVLADFTERNKDLVVDWEHATLTGNRAPAAAWIQALTKTAEGLVARVRYWTKQAAEDLEAGAYRYFSPVLTMSKRRPLALHSVALTNHPATHGLPALVTTDDADTSHETETTKLQESRRMENLAKVADALGMKVLALADGKEDEAGTLAAVLTRVAELTAGAKAVTEFLTLHDSADLGAVTGKIKGMVPATELVALNDRLALIDAEKAVSAAFADRKLTEAQRDWAMGYAKDNPTGFAAFVAKAPVAVPSGALPVDLKDTADTLALTDEALGRQFDATPSLAAEGLTRASYIAYRKADAAGLVKNATTKTAKE